MQSRRFPVARRHRFAAATTPILVFLMAGVAATAGCSSAYYATMEKFGVHKRDLLVKRVTQARESQVEAKEQFASALEQFRSVVAVDGGNLEAKYNLNAQAIAGLQGELNTVQTDVDALVRELNAAIAEADAFIREMEQ
jgi:hypothetical protein